MLGEDLVALQVGVGDPQGLGAQTLVLALRADTVSGQAHLPVRSGAGSQHRLEGRGEVLAVAQCRSRQPQEQVGRRGGVHPAERYVVAHRGADGVRVQRRLPWQAARDVEPWLEQVPQADAHRPPRRAVEPL